MFRAWIGQIVRRLGMDARRDQGRQRRRPDRDVVRLGAPGGSDSTGLSDRSPPRDPPARGRSPSTIARSNELARRLETVLEGQTDPTSAAIARLYFSEGLTLADISKKMDLPYHQVRDRYWKLVEKLRIQLGEWL